MLIQYSFNIEYLIFNIHAWLFQENIQTYTGEKTHKFFRQIQVFLKNFLKIRKYGFVKKVRVLFCQFKVRWNDRTCIYKLFSS